MIQLANQDDDSQNTQRSLRKTQHSVDEILLTTAKEYGVDPRKYVGFRSSAAGRDVAAYLCRRYRTATLAEISAAFGLGHQDSSSDLVKRARRGFETDKTIERRIRKIEERLSRISKSRD